MDLICVRLLCSVQIVSCWLVVNYRGNLICRPNLYVIWSVVSLFHMLLNPLHHLWSVSFTCCCSASCIILWLVCFTCCAIRYTTCGQSLSRVAAQPVVLFCGQSVSRVAAQPVVLFCGQSVSRIPKPVLPLCGQSILRVTQTVLYFCSQSVTHVSQSVVTICGMLHVFLNQL